MDCFAEAEGKRSHDPLYCNPHSPPATGFPVDNIPVPVVIVGAGPAGLGMAALLGEAGVPYKLLERCSCIGSLWRHRTYDRLCLHLPKQFCELPLMPFPKSFPTYPTRDQFLEYLESYARRFNIEPQFRQAVVSAEFNGDFWWIRTKEVTSLPMGGEQATHSGKTTLYRCKWLVVATGENAEPAVPEIEGTGRFKGQLMHSCEYRSGAGYAGKQVLVVGCGNSGMEVSLDLANHNAITSMVVRGTLHVLPREMLGRSTFGISLWLLRWFPVQVVDWLLLMMARFIMGDTTNIGITRPSLGPMELKGVSGKTPVLDVGTIAKIKSGSINVFPGVRCFHEHGVEFTDGRTENFDIVILATGYKSNVPYWLKEKTFFSEKDGFPRKSKEWKGKNGLYAVGFSRGGLLAVYKDAIKISEDIVQQWHDMCTEDVRETSSNRRAPCPI
ncbi:indole-3-pyruvate monooxygenase YUCCA4-like [Triticum dicoccoides]|uniref:indole-3-pyruvate monooxygenase YUCCA4-like n=1 Tax=Triticum dicoccoides TaxID=85692 RepID=UPI000E7BDE40|nr:indole-3-pyruvate monooxygenase YUCCA4-like [Triticum dicoccoides]